MAKEIKNGKCLIDAADYDDLIRKKIRYQDIRDILYASARLSYKKGELAFDYDIIGGYLKAVDEVRYNYELKRLEEEKARKEAEDREKVID